MTVEYHPDKTSNFKHKHPIVIQAWDNTIGWVDTIYGGNDPNVVQEHVVPKAQNPDVWIGGRVGKLRIVNGKKR